MTVKVIGIKGVKTGGERAPEMVLDGIQPLHRPALNLMQGFHDDLLRNRDLINQVASRTLDERSVKAEVLPYVTNPADWNQVAEMIEDYEPADKSDATSVKQRAWEFCTNLYAQLKLKAVDAYRSLVTWSKKWSAGLTHNKITQILSNARSATCYSSNIPTTLWNTNRWNKEKASRNQVRDMMENATAILNLHSTKSGWAILGEHEKLMSRQLNNWSEGRRRCGNSYWWIEYDSENLHHLQQFGLKTYTKTNHVCGAPGCCDCAMWETEKETAAWDWEASYGINFPVLCTLKATSETDAKDLKQAIGRMAKRGAIKSLWDGCFGAFIPTQAGYSLELMLKPDILNQLGAEQTIREQWGQICCDLFGKFGSVEFKEMSKPAIEVAIELTLRSERELWRLIDSSLISPSTGWKWFGNWIGDKPGAKGMNRIYHAPGFRRYKLELDSLPDKPEVELPEISPNMLDPELDLNSGEEKSDPEFPFPKTWFTLEKAVKRGWMLKIYDPYISQQVYLELGGNTLSSIPTEYLDELAEKPINRYKQPFATSQQSKIGPRQTTGLTPNPEQFKITQAREVKISDGVSTPWQTYDPKARAIEKGTWKGGRKQAVLAENQKMESETLELETRAEVTKKLHPDHQGSFLEVKLF